MTVQEVTPDPFTLPFRLFKVEKEWNYFITNENPEPLLAGEYPTYEWDFVNYWIVRIK